MLLKYSDDSPFSTGAAPYDFRPVTAREDQERIVLTVTLGEFKTPAFLDTGGVFFVCSSEIAGALGLDLQTGAPTNPLNIRGSRVEGKLFRLEVTFVAAEGEDLIREVTAFIPDAGQEWSPEFPCIVGLFGCLEQMLFAVDTQNKTFHFAANDEFPEN